MRFLALFSLLVLSGLSVLCLRARADTLLHYISESGDYIGQGEDRILAPSGGYTFSPSASTSHVGFTIDNSSATGDEFFSVDFAAPSGTNLAVGSYPGATRYPFQAAGVPGLNFDGEGRGSNELTGQFNILEISFDSGGNLLAFAADFVQHSEGAAPACYGQVRYNSSVLYSNPAGLAQLGANTYRVLATAGTVTVTVTRLDGSTGPLTASYSTADGTDLAGRDYTATTGTVSWADGDTTSKPFTIPILNSGNPLQGNGTFFINLTSPSPGPQTQATVTVVADDSSVTYLRFISASGDYAGQGQTRTLDITGGFVFTPTRNYAGGVSFSFSNEATVGFEDEEYGDLDFGAATGTIFGLGDFENAVGFGEQDSTHPGLTFDFDSRSESTLTGSNFQVLAATYDTGGNVLTFAANFVLTDSTGAAALTGVVRYNSAIAAPVIPGTVQFSSATYTAAESAGTETITVNRTGGTAGALTANYATADGTAVGGINYVPASGTLTWADGDATPKTFNVTVLDDGVVTADLTLGLTLTGTAVGTPAQATLTVHNVDTAVTGTVHFSSATYLANSTDGSATITVSRTANSVGAASVQYATADGTGVAGVNYTAVVGTLTWGPGDNTSRSFKVPLLDPVSALDSQTVLLTLSGTGLGPIPKATLTVVNANFPAPGTLSLTSIAYNVNETDGSATITVNRVGGSFGALSVNYTTLDGTAVAGRDYTAASGTLAWVDGDAAPKTFTVPIINSQGSGSPRTLAVRLLGANLGATTQATLTIAENVVPSVAVVSVFTTTPLIDEAGGVGIFVVSRQGDTSAALTVSYKVKGAAKAGVDYKSPTGTVTIPAGAVKAKVKLKAIDHAAVDGTLLAKFKLLPSADGSYILGGGTAKVKILDHD